MSVGFTSSLVVNTKFRKLSAKHLLLRSFIEKDTGDRVFILPANSSMRVNMPPGIVRRRENLYEHCHY